MGSVSEPVGAVDPQDPQEQPAAGRRAGTGRWVRSRPARWVAAGVAVVVIGGGAAAAAIHHEEEGHGERHAVTAADGEHHFMVTDGGGGPRTARDGRPGRGVERAAPAPLPSLDAADAVVKAAAAVPGGKTESLKAVTQQGGGRAWQAVVVGPDGVRHVVTVDGASGAPTGNTVLGG